LSAIATTTLPTSKTTISTSNGWFLREENLLGTIEPGKLADLAVLSDDYFTVPDESLKKIRSVMTVVNGSIAHNANIL
jgi:predicted amidohydrolase YtcJ